MSTKKLKSIKIIFKKNVVDPLKCLLSWRNTPICANLLRPTQLPFHLSQTQNHT